VPVTLRLHDTGTRTVRDFVPLQAGRVGIYVCGATVQSPPHIGHIRSSLVFDVLSRWLQRSGYAVDYVRNVTDIDDKILANAASEDVGYWVVAARNERAFSWAYDVLGCLPVTVEPRATGHIPEMVLLMHRLMDRGHAYESGGDVYFDVTSYADYGSLSGQRPDQMLNAETDEPSRKRSPMDFTLWKGAKPGEPLWETPWGPGRPGWHLECSAMAEKYLGATFDIHGGGLDLIFPHHENEQAQSRAAGDDFARYWMHHAWVTTGGEKMSKSLGNSALVTEVVKRVRPIELRYYLTAAHYRSHIEFTDEALQEAATSFRRVEGFLDRARDASTGVGSGTSLPDAFVNAMNDDLAVPAALAVLHDDVRAGNTALQSGDRSAAAEAAGRVRGMLAVLGLDPADEHWSAASGKTGGMHDVIDALVAVALEARADARGRKDFAAADAIRDQLSTAGVVIEDTPDGPRWTVG
jgi:cysteinyl-tRNA synthetase